MPNVVGAIRNLCQNSSANKDAVRHEGGITGLVELLKAGQESAAAVKAAETLEVVLDANAANERATTAAILEQPAGKDVLLGFDGLLTRLQKAAERVLMTAAERNDQSIFDVAMNESVGLGVATTITDLANARAIAVREQATKEAARRARRESLGLGALTTPNEFLCPITQDVMIDPVVASDGHSYERTAIQAILERGSHEGGQALSPLTREELENSLVPNINLRKRIREHDNEVESVAQQVLNSVGDARGRPAGAPIASSACTALVPGGGSAAGGAGSSSFGASVGGQSNRPSADGPAMVAFELGALGLQRYVSAFEEHGYDSWTELMSMRAAQLDKLAHVVSMASNHADRLRNALVAESKGAASVSPPQQLPVPPSLLPALDVSAEDAPIDEEGVKLEDAAAEAALESGATQRGRRGRRTAGGASSGASSSAADRAALPEEGMVQAPSPSEQMVAPREAASASGVAAAAASSVQPARAAGRKRDSSTAAGSGGGSAEGGGSGGRKMRRTGSGSGR